MSVQRPRGTSDLLPGQTEWWQRLEAVARETFRRYHFQEIRTPIFEHTEVFESGVGQTTDIVEKEMYTFVDKGDRSISLRPEGTAGVIRAYVENKLYGQPNAVKLFYVGPMFRYEKPQKGRERQFHQFGCEVLGGEGPDIDAEVITLSLDALNQCGLTHLLIELNSVGCPICRPQHKERMIAALQPVRHQLCKDCTRRVDRNPLRIFDCKNGCKGLLAEVHAPTILDALCADCETHFAGVQALLTELQVPYLINPHLVRGLDYYTRTAWEVTSEQAGTIGGGGRYNGLVRQLGGPEMPGIGFAIGMERAILLLQEEAPDSVQAIGLDVYVAVAVAANDGAVAAQKLLQGLRSVGLVADKDYQGKGLKAQFKAADRACAKFVAIVGEDELARGTVALKNLQSGEQQELALDVVVEHLVHALR